MKYLCIHKLIWFMLVAIFTLWELIFLSIIELIYFVWNLKLYKGIWKSSHASDEVNKLLGGDVYEDKTVFDTIKRRYKMIE